MTSRRGAYANVAEDLRQVSVLALRLKSTSRSAGATAFGDLCAELENAACAETRGSPVQSLARLDAAPATVDARIAEVLAPA